MKGDQEQKRLRQGAAGEPCPQTPELEELLLRGKALPAELREHALGCPECREEARTLALLRGALNHAAGEVTPPPDLRARVLAAARRSAVLGNAVSGNTGPGSAMPKSIGLGSAERGRARGRSAWLLLAGLAAAALLAVWLPQRAGSAEAMGLRDPAVVVAYGSELLVANNGGAAGRSPLSLLSGRGQVTPIALDSPRPSWFTEGLRVGDHAYLTDAGNDRVIMLDLKTRRVLSEMRMTGGVAGLGLLDPGAAGSSDRSAAGMMQDRVLCSTVSGTLSELGGREQQLGGASAAAPAGVPPSEVMDAVAQSGDTLYVTQHLRGAVALLDAVTLTPRRTVSGLGAPVALAAVKTGMLVLDHGTGAGAGTGDGTGRLLWLSPAGAVQRQLALGGHPDRLVLSQDRAVVSDRAGHVTRVDLNSGELLRREFTRPMDLTLMDDGHVALADAEGGVKILDAQLNVTTRYGGRP